MRCMLFTISSFIDNCTEKDHGKDELKEVLYKAYIKYCNEIPVPTDSYRKFGEGLRNNGFAMDTGGGNNKARVRGIRLKEEFKKVEKYV